MKIPLGRNPSQVTADEVTTHFIPFDRMTSDQQYDHVMDAHGFGESYYEPDYPGQVRQRPDAQWLKIMHEDDHTGEFLFGGSWICQHTHTKGTTNP